MSPTFSHSLCTSASASCLHVIKLSIQPSSVEMVAGSATVGGASSVGTRPTSSILVSMAEELRYRGAVGVGTTGVVSRLEWASGWRWRRELDGGQRQGPVGFWADSRDVVRLNWLFVVVDGWNVMGFGEPKPGAQRR